MLADFIRSQIRSLRRKSAYEDPVEASCLRVKGVAPVSIAAQAGLAPGDLLVTVDGLAASDLRPDFMIQPSAGRVLVFQRPGEAEQTELEAAGIDIGTEFEATAACVAARYRPGKSDPSELGILWEAGDWPSLIKLAAGDMVLDPKGPYAPSAENRDYRNYPSLIFLGAALVENGREQEGRALIDEYMNEYDDNWTMNFSAIGYYYAAQSRFMESKAPEGLELLEESYRHHPYDKTAAVIAKLSGRKPVPPTAFSGRSFPARYSMPVLAGSACGSLEQALSGLSAGQVMVVCLLASYRGNGPYNDFMKRYAALVEQFNGRLRLLHVITTTAEKNPAYPQYYEAEEKALARGTVMSVLFDQEGSVTRAASPNASPWCYVLDRSGIVHFEGTLYGTGLWKALAAADEPRSSSA